MTDVRHVSKQQKCDKTENVLEKIIENIAIIFLIKKYFLVVITKSIRMEEQKDV